MYENKKYNTNIIGTAANLSKPINSMLIIIKMNFQRFSAHEKEVNFIENSRTLLTNNKLVTQILASRKAGW